MKHIFTLALASLLTQATVAQDAPKIEKSAKTGKVYFGINMDTYILSSSLFDRAGEDFVTVPRFTLFPHFGTSAHYNFSRSFGIFSGLGIKNIGFIDKYNNSPDSTVIRRNYTIGIPLGLKFGNMSGTYAMIGGGIDIPFWYKEKGFVKRNDKDKMNEWFSQRSATVLPYVFVGARFHPGVYVKAVYYPTNFMNPDFKETENGFSLQPYKDFNVNLMMLSVGFDLPYRPKYD
ncbi:MAG: outer membrane beta-barrel protein [Taibaiella sp.]|nr:outer membrane beta-barrel protein [Taibaiella sp.]